MRTALLCASALVSLALARPALAQPAPGTGPQGGRVVAGQAAIGTAPGQTTITQRSERAAIDWQRFDVGRDHRVQFRQPSAQSWTLNRVQAGDPSVIAGRIQANGGVILTNPSGVVFSQGAQVNVGSLIASAPGITNEAFMAGRMRFDQPARPGARVSNAGEITVAQGGLAALVAPEVANSGRIRARLGRVVMGGAEAYALDLQGDGLIAFDVTEQVRSRGGAPALVTNSGDIQAEGGTVLLAARAAGGVIETLVSHSGSIEVGTGRAALRAQGADIAVSGRIGAVGGPTARGGTVEVVASGTARLAANAVIDASGGAGGGRVVVGAGAASRPGAPVGLGGGVAMAPGARIHADATSAGNGGTVILHSRNRTEALGAISARGAGGGDGGQVEVSSQRQVLMGATVDVTAPGGRAGSLLLDPPVVHVVAAFTGGGVSEVLASTIATTRGDFTLQAEDAIHVLAPIDKASGGLSLTTTGTALGFENGIFVEADITLRDSTRGFSAVTAGRFVVYGEASLTAPTISVNAGGIAVTGALAATAGDVALTANGAAGDPRVINGALSVTGRISGERIGLRSVNGFIHVGAAADAADAITAIPSAAGLFDEDLAWGVIPLAGASLRANREINALAGREVYVAADLAVGDATRSGSIGIFAGRDATIGGTATAHGSIVFESALGGLLHRGTSVALNDAGSALALSVTMSAPGGVVNTGLIGSRRASDGLSVAGLPGIVLNATNGTVRAGTIDSGGSLLVMGRDVRLDSPITGALGRASGGDVQLVANGGAISVEVPLTVPGATGRFFASADQSFHLAGFGDARGISANTIEVFAGGIALAGSLSAGLPALGHAGNGAITLEASGATGDAALLNGSITLFNTIRSDGATPIALQATNGFILVATAAQASDLLPDLGGPSRSALLRGNACPGACARIDALGSGGVALGTGGEFVNAGVVSAATSIRIAAAVMTNAGLVEAAGGPGRSSSVAPLALVVGGRLTNTGTLRATAGDPGSTAFDTISILTGGATDQGVTGRIEALAGPGTRPGAGRLSLTALGGFTNDGVASAAGDLAISSNGAIANTGSLTTPGLLSLATNGTLGLGGSVAAARLEATAAGIRLDGAALNVTQSAWFAAPLITAGAPTRLIHPSARPVLVFDGRRGSLPGTALADVPGAEDAAQPMQLAGFGAALAEPGALVALDLDAGQAGVFLLLDGGSASGRLDAGRLGVQGLGGAALLSGAIAGQDGPGSAARATLTPQADAAAGARYTLNGCVIALPACGAVLPRGGGGGDVLPAPGAVPVILASDDLPPRLPPASITTLGESATGAAPAQPSILLTASLSEAALRAMPASFLPPPRLVALRAPRARLADPDLVLPLGLADE